MQFSIDVFVLEFKVKAKEHQSARILCGTKFRIEVKEQLEPTKKTIGLDVGLESFYTELNWRSSSVKLRVHFSSKAFLNNRLKINLLVLF